ncbi:MAG: hypothetical protein SWY16_11050 [Cyanobacteriota bacterium]|nr:hypothetical protein [Cyanobacteriota bacterium]
MVLISTRTHCHDRCHNRCHNGGQRANTSFLQLDPDSPAFSARLGNADEPNSEEINIEDIDRQLDEQPDRERMRMLLIGSPLGVTRTIQTLDRLNFVELHRWSQFVSAPEHLHLDPRPGEVLSILTRYWLRQS